MPVSDRAGVRWSLVVGGATLLVAVTVGVWWVAGPPSRDALTSTEPAPAEPDRASDAGAMVPSEVVARLEAAPGRLEEVLAPEAAELGVEVEGALPADAELTVVADSWSAGGGSATLVAEIALPGAAVETHLVVLTDVDGRWLVAATYPVEP